jgi:plastocyanin
MNKTRILLLLSSSCLVALISLGSAYGQNENPKELYNECVGVANKSLCDFLFKRDGPNSTNNHTDVVRSNYTERPLTIPEGAAVQGNPHFDPNTITINKGDKITVTNKDTLPHTVTSGMGPNDPNSANQFDTSVIEAEGTANIYTTNTNLGEYPFHCTIHPYMTGKLVVTAGAAPIVPTTTTPSQFNYTNRTNSTSAITLNISNVTTPTRIPTINATTSPSVSNPLNSSYLTYKDNDLGFSIPYPSDWTIDNRNSQFSSVVGFSSPDGTGHVDVRVFPKEDFKSIKEYGDKEFKNSRDITLLGYYRNSTTMLDGKPAFRAVYLTTYNPSLFENAFGYKSSISKGTLIGTMVPEKKSIYAVAYFADPPKFDTYRPVVEKMIDSFKIYGKGPVIQEDNSSSSNP